MMRPGFGGSKSKTYKPSGFSLKAKLQGDLDEQWLSESFESGEFDPYWHYMMDNDSFEWE